MGMNPLCLILLSAFVNYGLGFHVLNDNASSIIVTSDIVEPGSELLIALNLLNVTSCSGNAHEYTKPDCTLDLRVMDLEGLIWHQASWKLELGKTAMSFSKTLKVLIPRSMAPGRKTFKLSSRSCINLNHILEVNIGWRKLRSFIRTNKLKYRPGEEVLVDILLMHPPRDQQYPRNSKSVEISVSEYQGALLMKWHDNPAKNGGLLRKRFTIPHVVFSDELIISLKSENKEDNLTIRVEQGAVDSFHVEVRTPRNHVLNAINEGNSRNLDISVVASQYDGAPINGTVWIDLSIEKMRKSGALPPHKLNCGYKKVELSVGTVKEALGLTASTNLSYNELNIFIKVVSDFSLDIGNIVKAKEDEGMNQVSRNATVTFIDQSYVLSFSQFTPTFFKPGLSYFVQVLLKPISEEPSKSPEEIPVNIKITHYTSTGIHFEQAVLKVKANNFGDFSFQSSKDDRKLHLEAEFKDSVSEKHVKTDKREIFPLDANNSYFIQLLADKKPPKVLVGEALKVMIEATFPTSKVFYQVFCGSGLTLAGEITAPSPATIHNVSVVIPQNVSHFLSYPSLVVEILAPSNEILNDVLQFVIEQPQDRHQLELSTEEEIVNPGENVEFLVKAEPFTTVYFIISSELLPFDQNGQKLHKNMAWRQMADYISRVKRSSELKKRPHLISITPNSQTMPYELGTLVLSEKLLLVDDDKLILPKPLVAGVFEKEFWNLNVEVGISGMERVKVFIPAKARLHTIAAFGLRPGKGLVTLSSPVQLLSTSKLVLSVRFPKKIVRGETLSVFIYLFNNMNDASYVTLVMIEHYGPESQTTKLRMLVGGNEQLSDVTSFPETQNIFGHSFQVEFYSFSSDTSYNVNVTVGIEDQGYPVLLSKTMIVDNFNKAQAQNLDVLKETPMLKKKLFQRAYLKIYGHPLGPSIEYVCQPSSSILDEPTKLLFVMSVNTLKLLSRDLLFGNSVSFGTPVNKDECIQTLRNYLQSLLNRRNPDGSFSLYPKHPGYIWLTSLMLETMISLQQEIFWKKEHVIETMDWLIKQQRKDGCFVEDERTVVLRNELDENSKHIILTSECVVSLIEASNKLNLDEELRQVVESAIMKSVEYIENIILSGDFDKDPHSLNIAAYALANAKSDKIFQVLKRRDSLIVHGGDEDFWNMERKVNAKDCPLSVEASSYAILTFLVMNDLSAAKPVVNFVLRAMKSNGAFVSTTDSHVALKALSQYFYLHNKYNRQEQINTDVTIALGNEEHQMKVLSPFFVGRLDFDNSNLSLRNSMEVYSSGEGLILVQYVAIFNSNELLSSLTLDVSVDMYRKGSDHLQLEICAINKKESPLNFIIAEVQLLSGHELLMGNQRQKDTIQVLGQDDDIFIIFNRIKPFRKHCTRLTFEKMIAISNLQAKYIRLYPSSDPGDMVVTSFGENQSEES